VSQQVIHLIPHTHWDREWYRTRAGFLTRLVPMLDAALATLDGQRDLPFLLDGQTVIAHDYLEVRPGARQQVALLTASRQLQLGPWYVLADELIPSGESLIRNLQLGRLDSAALGGHLDLLYSPDAFGHPAALPMLAAEFGLSNIVLWRGHAGRQDLWRWRAPDGTTIPVLQLPPDGYELGAALPAGQEALRAVWPRMRAQLLARAVTRHVAIPVGADHHPLRHDLLALAESLQALEPAAEVRISRLDDYLTAAMQEHQPLQTVEGELRDGAGYTWSLQGVHGTRLPLKRQNASTELLLERYAEPLAAMATYAANAGDDRALLGGAWRAVIESQFHDTIAGTVHDDAAREAAGRLAHAGVLGRAIRDRALRQLAAVPERPPSVEPGSGTLAVWNPRTSQAGGVAIVDVTRFVADVMVGPPSERVARQAEPGQVPAFGLDDGRLLHHQTLGERVAIERLDIPHAYPDADLVRCTRVALLIPPRAGLGISRTTLAKGRTSPPLSGVQVTNRSLRNEHLRVEPQSDGSFTLTGRNGVRLQGVLRLESERDDGDCYTPAIRGSAQRFRGPARWSMLARGPLIGAMEARWTEADADIRMLLDLRHGERALRVRLDVVNRGSNRRLRARLGIAGAPAAMAGSAFGFERRRRPAASAWSGEQMVFTAPAQRIVAGAGPGGGAAVLSAGHMEYELDDSGDLLLTMLRSTGDLSRTDLPERPGHAAWPTAVPQAQCHGPSSWSLAVMPVTARESDDVVLLQHAWEEIFLAPWASWHRGVDGEHPMDAAVELTGHGLVTSAIVPAAHGPGMVLRAVNLTDLEVAGAWRVRPWPGEAWRVRADETRLASLDVVDGVVAFRAYPRELTSILVL
jgi:alpha-mannosidase